MINKINDNEVSDKKQEFASPAQQQFASSFLLELMNRDPSEVDGLKALPADAFPSAWRSFVKDLENEDKLSEGLSAVLAAHGYHKPKNWDEFNRAMRMRLEHSISRR